MVCVIVFVGVCVGEVVCAVVVCGVVGLLFVCLFVLFMRFINCLSV